LTLVENTITFCKVYGLLIFNLLLVYL